MKPIMRIIIIMWLGFMSLPVVAVQGEDNDGGYSYAINLASSRQQFTADDVHNREILLPYRVYTTRLVKDGKNWNRLRVGFFENPDTANTALDEIRAFYPDAWIAEVSAEERLESSSFVIGFDNPNTIDKASEFSTTDFSEIKLDTVDEENDFSGTDPGTSTPPVIVEARSQTPAERFPSSPQNLLLTGADYGGDNAYYYAGLLVPFSGSDLGNGFVQRYWLDWVSYEYETWNRTIKAQAPGASVAVGYGKTTERGAWRLYLGPVWRDTDLSPDDPDSDIQGTQWGANISLQGNRSITEDWRASGIVSFTTGTESYWTRGRLSRRLASGHSAGIEAVFHGNDDYSAWQTGLLLQDFQPAPQTSLGLKFGARKTRGEDIGGYVGIELSRAY